MQAQNVLGSTNRKERIGKLSVTLEAKFQPVFSAQYPGYGQNTLRELERMSSDHKYEPRKLF